MKQSVVATMQPKKRKTAYELRKERKRALTDKVQQMQKQLDKLKFQLLLEQGEVAKSNARTEAVNAVLQELVQKQHVAIASSQAQLNGHAQRSLNALHPAQTVICLGKDWTERQQTLMGMKQRQLKAAEQYLVARSSGLDPRSTYCQEERFEHPGDDYCILRFEVVPVHGPSAKAVFDAIIGSVLNAEMILSEMFGSITIREDTDFDNEEFSQIRLASLTSSGATIESNTVLFSKFVAEEDDNGRGYGVMTADFVDHDELYPYHTGERVRRDTTSIVMVRSLDRPEPARKGPQVAVTRHTWLKIHRTEINISNDPERELQESSVCYGNTAKRCIDQQLAMT